MANCGADTEANRLLPELTQDASFVIPDNDLSSIVFPDASLSNPVVPLKIEDVTDGTVEGPGAFDHLMRGFKAHLQEEFDAQRITGDDYTKAYIALTDAAMAQSITFLMGKDQAFWQAQMIQVQAFSERVRFETAKVEMAAMQFNASNQKATYARTKMEVANSEIEYCTGKFNLEQVLPVTLAGQQIANTTATYNLANVLPKNVENLGYQGEMLKEQTEAQRAQTLDVRKDGQPVVGVLGKQKQLYGQQITSYQRDSELKAARMWSDSWITQKTIDEGLLPPATFENATVQKVMEQIRSNNNLGN